jgi:hypothetical protein
MNGQLDPIPGYEKQITYDIAGFGRYLLHRYSLYSLLKGASGEGQHVMLCRGYTTTGHRKGIRGRLYVLCMLLIAAGVRSPSGDVPARGT